VWITRHVFRLKKNPQNITSFDSCVWVINEAKLVFLAWEDLKADISWMRSYDP